MRLAAETKLRRSATLLPWLTITAVIVLWLWPITLLGQMPVGGDVTSFFLPLMSYYHRALVAGRIPLWNELWGFGFPMFAESQAGVLYPPHLLLFRFFSTETAYSANIVLHMVLAGLFAYLCGRSFGLKSWGATLSGLVFAGNGFFIIQFPHQWSYTTACWLPLAVALAWQVMRAEAAPGVNPTRRRIAAASGLALVLAVQMLAGHYQVAFYTQVTVLLLGLVCTLQALLVRIRSKRHRPDDRARATRPSPATRSPQPWGIRAGVIWAAVPVAGAFLLAAVQILPSYQLIQLAVPQGRDYEYLSGFAQSPFHLVSFLVPTLFHVNPLWRPVAWDPFHTSPEECFSYIGLLPLCLAVAGAWRWRHEPRVRLWILIAAVTLLLSLGPYTPLFRGLIQLPGFGGFRAPARLSVVTALFLALLAGRALDGLRSVRRIQLWLRRLVFAFLIACGASAAAILVLMDATAPRGAHAWSARLVGNAQAVWNLVSPWDDPDDLWEAARRASRPQHDFRAIGGLANLGYRVKPEPGEPTAEGPFGLVRRFTLADQLRWIALQELLPPSAILAILWLCICWLSPRRRVPHWLLLGLTAADLGAASWLRPAEFAPRRALLTQSPVLAHLARAAPGQRVLDDHQNLAMLGGAAPVRSYRTVDIPILWQVHGFDPKAPFAPVRLFARCDIAWELWDGDPAFTGLQLPWQQGELEHVVADPALGRILFGPGMAQAFPDYCTRFLMRQRNDRLAGRAWFWDAFRDTEQFTDLLEAGKNRNRTPAELSYRRLLFPPLVPLRQIRAEPELEEFELEATSPGAVIISELDYPGWEARLIPVAEGRGEEEAGLAEMRRSTGGTDGCRVVMVPEAGRYILQLKFRARSYEHGRVISALACLAWVMLACATFFPSPLWGEGSGVRGSHPR